MAITQERLKELLHYDSGTGVFTWRVRRGGGATAGAKAGATDTYGYAQITVDRHLYLAHQIAWLYMTGFWPRFEIDHRNRVRNDNAWSNLRPADRLLNTQNRTKPNTKNSTGLLGVSRYRTSEFSARITVNGKQRFLGVYSSAEQAHAVYLAAKRELHPGSTT